jgi:hypothetical protein
MIGFSRSIPPIGGTYEDDPVIIAVLAIVVEGED